MTPKVSIIIPARCAQDTIEKSCRSVLDQDYKDFELIVVVNGPKDKTPDIVLSLKDPRISLIESDEGIVPALNKGIQRSKCDIISRQDADDIWEPNKLSKQMAAFDSNLADVIGTQMKIVKDGTIESVTNYPINHDEIIKWFERFRNPIGHPTVAYKRSVLDKVGGYWDFFPFAEDLDLWMRMLPYARFANLDFAGIRYNSKTNLKYNHEIPKILIRHYAMLYKDARTTE